MALSKLHSTCPFPSLRHAKPMSTNSRVSSYHSTRKTDASVRSHSWLTFVESKPNTTTTWRGCWNYDQTIICTTWSNMREKAECWRIKTASLRNSSHALRNVETTLLAHEVEHGGPSKDSSTTTKTKIPPTKYHQLQWISCGLEDVGK